MDAVSACHSAVLGAPQAAAAVRALGAYHERFRGRLAPGAVAAIHIGSLSCEQFRWGLCSKMGCSLHAYADCADSIILVRLMPWLAPGPGCRIQGHVHRGLTAAASLAKSLPYIKFLCSLPECFPRTGNSQHIQTLAFVAQTLLDCLEKSVPPGAPRASQNGAGRAAGSSGAVPARVLTVNDFLFATGLDNVNLFQLLRRALLHVFWCVSS